MAISCLGLCRVFAHQLRESCSAHDALHATGECGWLARTDNGTLQGTTTGDKNEILWQHGINYQSLPEQFKKVRF